MFRTVVTIIPTFGVLVTMVGCGFNLYGPLEEVDPIEQAIIHLEQGEHEKAVDILQGELQARPNDREVLSLLSTATAAQFGFDPLSYALALAAPAPEGKNNVTKTFLVLPEATDDNIEGLQSAIDFLLEIDPGALTAVDRFKLAMFNSAIMGLISKKFANDTGELTMESLAEMSIDEAIMILSSLDNAEAVLQSGALEGENSGQAANQVSNIKAAIDNEEGANDVEKLQNYLASR